MLAIVPSLVSLVRGLGVSPSETEGGVEMHDVALRRRIAALVLAALLSVAAASVAVGAVADDAQALTGGLVNIPD